MNIIRLFSFSRTLAVATSLLVFSSPALAGIEVINGGDAVVCRDPLTRQIQTAQLFDFYEGKSLRAFDVKLGDSSFPFQTKVDLLIERVRQVSPLRAKLYQSWANSFAQEALFLAASELVPIDDAAAIAAPDGCKIEQLASQRDPILETDPRYVINKDLWDHLDNDSKAGLEFHELIYREARTYGHRQSTYVRILNSMAASDRLTSLDTPAAIFQFFLKMKFGLTDFNGLNFVISSCESTPLVPAGVCETGAPAVAPLTFSSPDQKLQSGRAQFPSDAVLQDGPSSLRISSSAPTTPFAITYYPSGRIESLDRTITILGPTFDSASASFNAASLYDDADSIKIKCARIESQPATLKNPNGSWVEISNSFVLLDSSGILRQTWNVVADAPTDCWRSTLF